MLAFFSVKSPSLVILGSVVQTCNLATSVIPAQPVTLEVTESKGRGLNSPCETVKFAMTLMSVTTGGMVVVLRLLAVSTRKDPFIVNAPEDSKLKMELPLVAMTIEFSVRMVAIVIRMLSVSKKLD